MFAGKYNAKYDKAVACLIKDREALLAYFDFPAEHWDHLRTSNPIESVFATVRHRTVRTKGAPSFIACGAAKSWPISFPSVTSGKAEHQCPTV
jgi:transposase-like protein